MATKAVQITGDNREYLRQRWNLPEDDLDMEIAYLPSGHFLVADFGEEGEYMVLSPEVLKVAFTRTGVQLDNEFFEIRPNLL